jgi:hypothetical protein
MEECKVLVLEEGLEPEELAAASGCCKAGASKFS